MKDMKRFSLRPTRKVGETKRPYADCDVVTLVMDNFNTHAKGAFYEAFEPHKTKAYMRRLKFCYTPKHGIQLFCLNRQLNVLSKVILKTSAPAKTTQPIQQ